MYRRSSLISRLDPGPRVAAMAAPSVSTTGRVLYTADAYRNDEKRFTVIVDDKLTAFLELEATIRTCGELS